MKRLSFVAMMAMISVALFQMPLWADKSNPNVNSGAYSNSGLQQDMTININTAVSEELQKIKGIGPRTAERIIAYREEHGNFQSVEEIANVRGIGPAKYERIEKQVAI